MNLSLGRIAEFTTATGEFDPRALAQGYSIDSRTVQSGTRSAPGAPNASHNPLPSSVANARVLPATNARVRSLRSAAALVSRKSAT